jgi:regulation of enolase protein 1 (concanavalin A-like superfamily)/RimJ/RimL family protein N-acetyltransferase
MPVRLQPITVDNWKAAIGLSLHTDQQHFLPDNLYSIAEAQFYPDACPLAIYDDQGQMVGFVMYGRDVFSGHWKVFRLMIDAAYQGRGYGRAAMQQVIATLAAKPDSDTILICYHDDNQAARQLYARLGFVEQSVDADGKATAQLNLKETEHTMQWLNEPATWNADSDRLTMRAAGETDFWRKTHDGGMRDNGHFYAQAVTGDFTAKVKVSGQYNSLYDQAGIMVRLDETTWLKCGIEYVENVQYASTVVTRDYSDWSILPLEPAPPSLYLRITRHGGTLEVAYALDGATYTMIRQAHLTDADTVQVGPMAAAPKGDGFEVVFEGFAVNQ